MRSPSALFDTSVRYVTDGMLGFTPYTGVIGDCLTRLKAFLVTGGTELTITEITVASGVATIKYASTPGAFGEETVIRLTGVPSPYEELNGDHKVKTTFDTFSTLAVSTADVASITGTIKAKLAPLDYTEEFTGTNVSVFKSSDPESYGTYLRVEHSVLGGMKVKSYETMTGVSTGTGVSPHTPTAFGAPRPACARRDGHIYLSGIVAHSGRALTQIVH